MEIDNGSVRWMTEEMGNVLTAGNPGKREELMILVDLESNTCTGKRGWLLQMSVYITSEIPYGFFLQRPRKVSVQEEKAGEGCCTLVTLTYAPGFQSRVQNFC